MAPPELPPSPWQTPKFTGEPWWTKDTVAVVTGSNRGIGYEILRSLAKYGLTTVLTDIAECEASLAALKAEGLDSVYYHPVDVTSSSSVAELAAWLKEKFGGIDILINNAGLWDKSLSYEAAKRTFDVNYFGVKTVTDELLPLMKSSAHGARIVNITSRLGFYQRIRNDEVTKAFQDVEHLTTEVLDSLAAKYLEDMKSGNLEKEGWIPRQAIVPVYSESKMLASGYTLVLSKALQAENPADQKIFVTAFCPGLTQTEMIGSEVVVPGLQPHPVEVGIDTGVWLSLLPRQEIEGKHGKFFGERLEYSYTWVPWIDPFAPPA